MKNNLAPLELCPRCHASIPFASYTLPYSSSSVKAFYTPAMADISAIENDLIMPDADLAEVATEIARVKVVLQALEKQHAYLETHVARTRQFIRPSPIRKLPTEVLVIIFELACASDFHSEYRGTAICLGVVCSKWRSILLNTPALWTTIIFGPDDDSTGEVNCYLDRCGKMPLFVDIESPLGLVDRFSMDGVEADERRHDHFFEDVMRRLLLKLTQWKQVQLYLDFGDFRLFEKLLIGAFQVDAGVDVDECFVPIPCPNSLESVTLGIRDGPHDAEVVLPKAFQSAPNLTSFAFDPHVDHMALFPTNWPTCGLPWKQIREIFLDQNNLAILRDLPEEVYTDGKPLTLTIGSENSDWETNDEGDSPETFVLDKFTGLYLHPGSWTFPPDFLDAISMPALQDATLDCPLTSALHKLQHDAGGEYLIFADHSLRALTLMVSRSECALKTFTFCISGDGDVPDNVPFDDSFAHAVMALLQETPELESLELIEGEMRAPPLLTEEFFKVCSMPGGLVPKLKSLTLVWAGDRRPSTGLIPMLQSRLGGPLTSVVLGVRNGGELGPETLGYMRQLGEAGVQATLW